MKPYYRDDYVTIYHADCRDLLPTLTADAVLTDPPYGLNYRGWAWDESVPVWLDAARLSAPVVAFTTAPTTLWDYPRPHWVACWARPASNSRTAFGGFNHWTPILVYGKPPALAVDLISLHAIQHSAAPWNTHPSPKPDALMRWMVSSFTRAGDIVLDPFMGSGTTLRAAKDLGRRAIGIEIDEAYCELAASRMGQEVLAI